MSDVKANLPQTFSQKAAECVPRYVGHSIGGSVFFLAYAMANTGIVTFSVVIAMEAYFTGCSLLHIQEMVQGQNHGEERINYFLAIEKHLCKKTRQFIRFLFLIDVINCTAFYYKICQSLFESLVFENHVQVKYRTGTTIIACTLTTVFLIGMEYGQKYWLKSHRSSQVIMYLNVL
uniref:uncharacterized protein LOC120326561 n=1 Tax=Styela clava TaxID=7725 RepID=UPI00193A052A|nr:uncharacterized protein LOC120326561 [Styela clava]